jgi:phage/plasmid-like protein (TIGR03299 family)
MAHELENKDGRYSFAFTGDRSNIWHQLGQELPADASRAEWIDASGFNYSVSKVPAVAALKGPEFDHLPQEKLFQETDQRFIVRSDTGHVLGFASDGYQIVQPAAIWDWFENYITVDERFHIDAAGVLKSGEKLWMTARFNGDVDVAGDSHKARLLMSTSFDCSQPTINQATMTRVVCANTMRMAHSDARAAIRTRHSTKFDGKAVARELAQIAQSFANYKVMGDAMAQVEMTGVMVGDFFKKLLDIDNVDKDKVSTRTRHIFEDLKSAYWKTQEERNTKRHDAWSALQAVTRYVDHDRTVRNADHDIVGRFDSGLWGSGDAMKGKALDILKELANV